MCVKISIEFRLMSCKDSPQILYGIYFSQFILDKTEKKMIQKRRIENTGENKEMKFIIDVNIYEENLTYRVRRKVEKG